MTWPFAGADFEVWREFVRDADETVVSDCSSIILDSLAPGFDKFIDGLDFVFSRFRREVEAKDEIAFVDGIRWCCIGLDETVWPYGYSGVRVTGEGMFKACWVLDGVEYI